YDGLLYSANGRELRVYNLARAGRPRVVETIDKKGKKTNKVSWNLATVGDPLSLPNVETMLIADRRLFLGTTNEILALRVPLVGLGCRPFWKGSIAGTPVRMVASNDRLFVTTREGRLYCFGGPDHKRYNYPLPTNPPSTNEEQRTLARQLLDETGVRAGYAV